MNGYSDKGIKRAFLTGASTGIGESTALALAAEGYDVALAGRNTTALASVKDKITSNDGQAHVVGIDLRDPEHIKAAIGGDWSEFGPCHALVNCGGITVRKPAVDVSVEEWDNLIDTNLRGSFLTACEFARHLIAESRPGAIVNVGSTHGLVGFANLSVYGISKAGLHHMTKMLAIEWAKHRIRVNAVAPGATETPSRAKVFSDPVTRERLLERIPIRQFAASDDVAAAILYLLSPKAEVITGHTLVLDGGLTAY